MKTRRGFIGALAVGLLVALPGSGRRDEVRTGEGSAPH